MKQSEKREQRQSQRINQHKRRQTSDPQSSSAIKLSAVSVSNHNNNNIEAAASQKFRLDAQLKGRLVANKSRKRVKEIETIEALKLHRARESEQLIAKRGLQFNSIDNPDKLKTKKREHQSIEIRKMVDWTLKKVQKKLNLMPLSFPSASEQEINRSRESCDSRNNPPIEDLRNDHAKYVNLRSMDYLPEMKIKLKMKSTNLSEETKEKAHPDPKPKAVASASTLCPEAKRTDPQKRRALLPRPEDEELSRYLREIKLKVRELEEGS